MYHDRFKILNSQNRILKVWRHITSYHTSILRVRTVRLMTLTHDSGLGTAITSSPCVWVAPGLQVRCESRPEPADCVARSREVAESGIRSA